MKPIGRVNTIYTAPKQHQPMVESRQIRMVAGRGIEGDRYFNPHTTNYTDQITLIDTAMIDLINRQLNTTLRPIDFRRNIASSGIDLNALEHGQFQIGNLTFESVELCEPCKTLLKHLGIPLPSANIMRELTHRCGLRAKILSTGVISVGDSIVRLID